MKTEKKCSKCKAVLPLENFSPRGASKDGKQFACKPCMRSYNLNYYHQERRGKAGFDFTPAYTTVHSSGYSKQEIADYRHTHTLPETRAYFQLSAYQIRACYKAVYGGRAQAEPETPKDPSPLERKLRRMKGKTYVYNCQFVKIQGFEVQEKEVILQTDHRPLPLPLRKINWVLEREFLPMER